MKIPFYINDTKNDHSKMKRVEKTVKFRKEIVKYS